MGKLRDVLKKVGNGLGDIGKTVAKVAVSPINSLRGHEYDPRMKTALGNKLEKAADFIEDVQTKAVTTATFGLTKKLGLFDGEVETKAGKIVGTALGIAAITAGTVATVGAIGGAGFGVKGGLQVIKNVVTKAPAVAPKPVPKASDVLDKLNATVPNPRLHVAPGLVQVAPALSQKVISPVIRSFPPQMLVQTIKPQMITPVKDAVGIASITANSGIEMPDLATASLALDVVRSTDGGNNKSGISSILTGLGGLLSSDTKNKINDATKSVLGSLGIKQTTETKSDSSMIVIVVVAVLVLIFLFKK